MKIKMLVSIAGSGFTLSPGDEHDFTDGEAQNLIGAGYGVPVSAAKIERAVAAPAVETRAVHDPRKAKRGKNK